MQVRHNFGPENGLQHTAADNQTSENTDFLPRKSQPDPDGHACAINRNNRGKCQAWKAGALSPALRCFAQHHNWHDPGIYTNKRILRRVFAKPIAKAVAELALDGKTAISAQIQTDFARLQETTRSLDQMCIKRIDEDDEEVVFEHIKEQLNKIILELAAMLESGQKSGRKIADLPPDEAKIPMTDDQGGCCAKDRSKMPEPYITFAEAASLLAVSKGTVSRWAGQGRLTDNGKRGQGRKLSKASVLILKAKREQKDMVGYAADIQRDAARLDRLH